MNEYGYFSKEVSAKLDINSSTLRQWCKSIEDQGYEIERNDKDQRIFYERDINMLFELKNLINKTRNRDNAIHTVVSRYNSNINASNTLSVNGNEHDNKALFNQLLEHIKTQENFNQELIKRLDNQQKYIDERLKQHDQNILEAMEQSLKTQKQIAAAQEENKKGFFYRLFGQKK